MEKIRLIGAESNEDTQLGIYNCLNAARALLFGRLINLSVDSIKHYRSDFYHDANWMNTHLTKPHNSFYFGWRECGTAIGTSFSAVETGNDNVVKVTLWLAADNCWHCEIDPIKGV